MANKVTIIAFLVVYLCVNSSRSATVVRGDRGKGDYFSNPDCDSTTCPNTCPQYHAHCSPTTKDINPCPYCYCRGDTLTYVGKGKDGGRCVSDVDIIKDTNFVQILSKLVGKSSQASSKMFVQNHK